MTRFDDPDFGDQSKRPGHGTGGICIEDHRTEYKYGYFTQPVTGNISLNNTMTLYSYLLMNTQKNL
jgi:hypothetical protein